jgi:hypothetical protein
MEVRCAGRVQPDVLGEPKEVKSPIDYTPTGSRVLDVLLNVIDGVGLAILLVLFLCFGKVNRHQ